MIKVLLFFVLIFALFFLGIKTIRNLTGKEALALTKIVGYSIICAILTVAVLISIVVIF
jgi:hypothetical protein